MIVKIFKIVSIKGEPSFIDDYWVINVVAQPQSRDGLYEYELRYTCEEDAKRASVGDIFSIQMVDTYIE